jgi:drug/metabolite transporter (DMT)-like permease
MAPEVGRARPPTRAAAVALALFVTVLWSSSWVLIKRGLEALPALTFAVLHHTLAAACKRSRRSNRACSTGRC